MHGQGPHEHGIGDAEGRGGGAEAETEDDHGRDREPGVLRQRAGADPEVLPQVCKKLPPPLLPLPVPVDVHARGLDPPVVAETPLGFRARRHRIAALPDELLDKRFQVMAELRVDVGADIGSPEPEIPSPHRCMRHLYGLRCLEHLADGCRERHPPLGLALESGAA